MQLSPGHHARDLPCHLHSSQALKARAWVQSRPRPCTAHAAATAAPSLPAPTLQQGRLVQWYPGHIAKTERQLREQLTMVDVVLEVRDARIPQSSTHPSLAQWCKGKVRLLVMNRVDQVSFTDRRLWHTHLKQQHPHVCWTDAATGMGTSQLKAVIQETGEKVNAQRAKRGLEPRAVRACVIGFPNVGKSALINRLLGRRLTDSAPKPGVTRQLRWVRVGGTLDMLDAPGVIPAQFRDQLAAQHLAMCNDIGEAAYTDSLIAAALYERLVRLPKVGMKAQDRIQQRYGRRLGLSCTGEDLVRHVARTLFNGQLENGAQRMLKDFRTGVIGRFALELPA